jgi:hypothetical protein
MMNLRGTTPATTWRHTLKLLALGLFALPLLPALAAAQPRVTQDDPQPRVDRIRADRAANEEQAKTEAELQKAKADLAQLQAEIKLAQDRIKAIEARNAAKQAPKADKPKDGIMILRMDGGGQTPNEIVLRKVGDKWEVVQPKAKQPEGKQPGQLEFQLEIKGDEFRLVPVEPKKAPPRVVKPVDGPIIVWEAVPAKPPAPGTGKTTPEGRLEELERQLQKIMKELESLRKEMKQPGKTGAATRTTEEPGIQLHIEGLEIVPAKPVPEKKPTPKPEEN